MNKLKYFENEMTQLDLSDSMKAYLREQMLEGLEIMTKAEIKQCIQDHVELMGS
jgi:hypothetical protein